MSLPMTLHSSSSHTWKPRNRNFKPEYYSTMHLLCPAMMATDQRSPRRSVMHFAECVTGTTKVTWQTWELSSILHVSEIPWSYCTKLLSLCSPEPLLRPFLFNSTRRGAAGKGGENDVSIDFLSLVRYLILHSARNPSVSPSVCLSHYLSFCQSLNVMFQPFSLLWFFRILLPACPSRYF